MNTQYLMTNPNAKPFIKTVVTSLKDSDFTVEYYKLKVGKRWIPKFGWRIEEGDVKRIPKRELKVVPELYERVYDYVPEKSEKTLHEINAGGEIETGQSKKTTPNVDIFKKYDLNIDALIKGDSDEERKLKKFGIDTVEMRTMICNESGKAFDSREQFFKHKLKLYEKSKVK